jgi:hypothetical protein
MFTEIEQGREITLVGENKGNRYTITPTEDVFTGESTFAIEEQFIEKDRYHVEVSQNADRTGITVSEREIVLKVKGDGKIAAIRLSADADSNIGTEINIVADQVKINRVRFVSSDSNLANNAGYIESIPFTSGTTGWRISGLGDAEFNNVIARGSLIGGSNDKRYEITPSNGIVLGVSGSFTSSLSADTLTLDTSASVDPAAPQVTVKGDDISATYGNMKMRWLATDVNNATLQLFTSTDPRITLDNSGSATFKGAVSVTSTTEATSTTTGSTVLSGGLGVAKNVHVGGILVAPIVSIQGITDGDSPFSASNATNYIATDSSTGVITINLPVGAEGRKITIFDYNGSAVTNTVTINRASTDTINGATSTTLTTAYQSVTLVFYSGNWTII